MKVVSVVGARPQFIKAAALSRALRRRHTEILVHTGQHYDPQMSDVFFRELEMAAPDHHLGVGSGSHGRQTGQMLERLEPVLERERPDAVVVYGDTNSTVAGALATAKLGLPLAHVEAGLRSFSRAMPEEVNRVVADHLADLLFAPTDTAMANLAGEGLAARARLTGDIMYDSLRLHLPIAQRQSAIMGSLRLRPGCYLLATVHRAANTDNVENLRRILEALSELGDTVVFPVHPRARLAINSADLETEPNVRSIEPVGYLDMLVLERNARAILTDSGGVQKEAYLLGVPCVTLRRETEWPETLAGGWNVLADTDPPSIIQAARRRQPTEAPPAVFGDGHAAERMVELLEGLA